MNKQPRITFGKFTSTGCAGDDGEAYVYANGVRVGEIWRRMVREFDYSGRYHVASYVAEIWTDDVGNNDPAFAAYVRDNRGNVVQAPAQAKAALRRRIAEHFESLESDAA